MVRPGPGPISRTSSPRSPAASIQGSSSASSIWRPLGAGKELQVGFVHALTCTMSGRMAVSAQSDKVLSFSAKADQVDMRSGSRQSAGSYTYEGDELITTWHAHDLHQLEYAFHGTVEVETATAHFLLPPQQAAWIPSGVDHRTTIRTTVRTISVFFESDLVPDPGGRVRIVAVPPVLREMMIYSGRWPIGRSLSDPDRGCVLHCVGPVGLRGSRQ